MSTIGMAMTSMSYTVHEFNLKLYCVVQSIVHLKPAKSLLFVNQSLANRIKCLRFQPISSVSTTLLPLLSTYSFIFFSLTIHTL